LQGPGLSFQLSVVRSGSVVLADGQLVLHSSSVRRHHYFSFDVQKNHSERRKQQVGRLDLAAEGYLIFFSGIDRMRKATDLCGVIFWTFFLFCAGKGIANTWKRGIYEDFRATCFFLGGGLAGVAWHSFYRVLLGGFFYLLEIANGNWLAGKRAGVIQLTGDRERGGGHLHGLMVL